jgi:hypothetical protein
MLRRLLGIPETSRSPLVQQYAEEYGQARELTSAEVMSCMVMSAMKGLTGGLGITLIYVILCIFSENDFRFWLAVGIFFSVAIAIFCTQAWGDLDDLRDGLRSYRKAETYAPPQPGMAPRLPAPDITVRPYKGDPYKVIRGGPGAPPDTTAHLDSAARRQPPLTPRRTDP